MKTHFFLPLLIFVLLVLQALHLNGQTFDTISKTKSYKYSFDFCPMSPVFKIYAIHFNYRFTKNSELIVGPYYANIQFEGLGHTNAPGFIIGIRQYIWRNLHVDYQLMPQWDRYYDLNEDKVYPTGFDLWNEFRLGYAFNFQIKKFPMYINVQWPLGFILYSDPKGKSEAFKVHAQKQPYFYFPPLFFVGFRF